MSDEKYLSPLSVFEDIILDLLMEYKTLRDSDLKNKFLVLAQSLTEDSLDNQVYLSVRDSLVKSGRMVHVEFIPNLWKLASNSIDKQEPGLIPEPLEEPDLVPEIIEDPEPVLEPSKEPDPIPVPDPVPISHESILPVLEQEHSIEEEDWSLIEAETKEQNKARRIRDNALAYFGPICMPVYPAEMEHLQKVLPNHLCSVYLRGNNISLKKAAVYMLILGDCEKNFRYMTVAELLAVYLGKDQYGDIDGNPDRKFHLDLNSPILILHNIKHFVANKMIDSLVCQMVSERHNRGLITILLDEQNLADIRKTMKEIGISSVEKNLSLKVPKKSMMNVVESSSDIVSPV